MTIYEFCDLFSDAATVEIFSFEKGETIYRRGSVGWLSNGRYLIAAADGSAADVRTINR
jgi:hypothetical protein